MRKILATMNKEWILMRRDAGGFLLLFLMPAFLIIVMALVQDAPFKDYQEIRFDLLLADNDHGSLSKEIKTGLNESKNFRVIESYEGKPLTDAKLKELLQKGKYQIGIVIPKDATAEIVNSANIIANNISKKIGMGTFPVRKSRDSTYVHMYFDPVSKPTFRMSIRNALDKYITYSCSNLLVKRLNNLSKEQNTVDTTQSDDFKKVFGGIGLKEELLGEEIEGKENINSVQHNVPAWAIFGMFFIAIPIIAHTIKEREEGSSLRVELIPNTYKFVALGKIKFYTLICTAQFICMLAIGLWVLPLFGLSKLHLGQQPWALLPVAIAIAFAATSFGYLIGAIFKTSNQALPFGSITIIILSALGGIWVPVELLPPVMKKIALVSPLHWGLDAVHHLILRNGSIKDVWLHIALLLAFGFILWLISILLGRTRRYSF